MFIMVEVAHRLFPFYNLEIVKNLRNETFAFFEHSNNGILMSFKSIIMGNFINCREGKFT